MPTLVLNNAKKLVKYIGIFLGSIIGLYVITLLLQCIFIIGTYFGTYLRCLYYFVCNNV